MKPQTLAFLEKHSNKWAPGPGPCDDVCFIWHASTLPSGHGQVWSPELGRPTGAHRVVAELEHGPLGHKDASHLCHVAACVNPAHIIPETHVDNAKRKRLGLKGKGYRQKAGKYEARSWENGKQVYLGFFETEQEARDAVTAHWERVNKTKRQA